MTKEILFPILPDQWKRLPWNIAPDKGVFICELEKGKVVNGVPEHSLFAVKIEPGYEITLHWHEREANWKEKLIFPTGGHFKILGEEFRVNNWRRITLFPKEVYNLKNLGTSPLYFYSFMKPGFTDFNEIHSATPPRLQIAN